MTETENDSGLLAWVLSPLAWLSGVVGGTIGILGLDPIIQTIIATSGTWFSLVAVVGGTIAPNVPAIPTALATQALVTAGAVYALIKLYKLTQKL
jgi:hypothetical protein